MMPDSSVEWFGDGKFSARQEVRRLDLTERSRRYTANDTMTS